MHPDQYAITPALVRDLVDDHFPDWRDLPLVAVPSTGTVSALFRLGDRLLVRLPLQPGTLAADLAREHETLQAMTPVLAPVAVPTPIAVVAAGPSFPSPWSIVDWLPGAPARYGSDDLTLARTLGAVVQTVQALPVEGETRRGRGRGGRLATVDTYVRTCLERDAATIAATPGLDVARLISLWGRTVDLPGATVWTRQHGDLMPGNLLLSPTGGLSAVIDWSSFDLGDPAYDLMPAWNLFVGTARAAFLAAAGAGPDAVQRSRGWALAQAVGCLRYYEQSNPAMSRLAADTLRAVLSEDD